MALANNARRVIPDAEYVLALSMADSLCTLVAWVFSKTFGMVRWLRKRATLPLFHRKKDPTVEAYLAIFGLDLFHLKEAQKGLSSGYHILTGNGFDC
jgi:hypothetical protein